MKKSYLFISMALVFTLHSLWAQRSVQPGYEFNPTDTSVQEGMITNGTNPARVHIRAARDFVKRFRGGSATWQQSNNAVIAKFTADSVTTFVGYGKFGNWLYTVRCLSEWAIPQKIRHEVRSMYYDYQINAVYELVYPRHKNKVYLFYSTHMNNHQKVIRWSENGIEVVKESTKK
ncbi:MAG: hypothetical protein EOP49_41020 [Sphingobacteriales bacterium]|nr:MAG: hypothetical protein EOP49_41020 [Sphingobacteriales bacterium]